MLKFAKFDAIRRNAPVSCQIAQQGGRWLVWVDSNGNGTADQAEPQMYIGGSFTLLPDGVAPNPAPIKATLGPGFSGFTWTVVSGANGNISYDQRGVSDDYIVSVLFLGSATDPRSGYRAVISLPSGAVQVWSSSSAGDWHRVS